MAEDADRFVVRATRPADAGLVAALGAGAFSPEPDRIGWGDWDEDPALIRLCVQDELSGRLVATAQARLTEQWWGGRPVPAAALAGVAVDLPLRGLGIGRRLVARLIADARTAGAQALALIPSTHAFYARLGCGVAGRRPVFRIDTADLLQLPAPTRRYSLRDATPADTADVAALVRARAVRGNGQLEHHTHNGGRHLLVVDPEGRTVGWVLLGRRAPQRTGGLFTVVVHDLVADDPDAELAAWRQAVADPATARDVEALVAPGTLLEHLLPRQVEPVENNTWMLGLLDPAAALASRGYPSGLRVELALDVDGERLTLSVDGGRGAVRTADAAAEVDLRMSGALLASVFAGHTDPLVALAEGRMSGSEAPASALRGLFAGPAAVLTRPF
ncbi:enhanced intracellular survival protein Eis [Kineococcus gynurae]|uniref:Enhanced intracellular survival protein Eis n=1 Tax=Kineococcus gynurae TaxID=452979 RepID=A0ABV5LN36_9ACTN